MSALRSARVRVSGHVQNVGYRVFVAREAGRLHLHGFVRNRSDGSVETFVEGPPEKVEEFLALAVIGPGAARIDAHRVEDANAEALTEFKALAGDHNADGFFSAPAL